MRKSLFLMLMVLFGLSCEKTTVDPTPPVITVSNATVTEGDDNVTASIILQLDKASETNIVFNYSTIEGTATGGIDFQEVANETFIINAGTTTADLNFTIIGDDVDENTEEFEVALLNPVGASFSRSKVKITIEDDDAGGGVAIPATGYSTPDNYAGMTLVWRDEFDGPAISSDWTFEIGTGNNGWGNNELQYYRQENASIVNGNLVIEARNEAFGGRNYTSSRMITQGAQSFKYGRIDIRAALPQGQGIWPALWMLGDNFSSVGWPACGEIDIMELLGHLPSTVYGTVHWESNGQHADYGGNTTLNSGTFSDEFHVFSIVWDANSIRWLLDDVQFHVIDTTPSDLSEFQEKFFFIFNVAVGGNWPGNPDATTPFPQRMIVDYVRVFQ